MVMNEKERKRARIRPPTSSKNEASGAVGFQSSCINHSSFISAASNERIWNKAGADIVPHSHRHMLTQWHQKLYTGCSWYGWPFTLGGGVNLEQLNKHILRHLTQNNKTGLFCLMVWSQMVMLTYNSTLKVKPLLQIMSLESTSVGAKAVILNLRPPNRGLG